MARMENAESEKDMRKMEKYKLTKCKYFDQRCCNCRKQCKYSHPEQRCEHYIMNGKCSDQNCPYRHKENASFGKEPRIFEK